MRLTPFPKGFGWGGPFVSEARVETGTYRLEDIAACAKSNGYEREVIRTETDCIEADHQNRVRPAGIQ